MPRSTQPLGQRIGFLNMVVPDRDVVARKLAEAAERTESVEVVIEDGNPHAAHLQPPSPWS